MNSEAVGKVKKAIADDMLILARLILNDQSIGFNKKVGKNTLQNSSLQKDVRVGIKDAGDSVVIEALFNNYIDYIEKGRKPKSGKQPPIGALKEWALSCGIPTDNSTLFLISRAIWRDGYEGRPILAVLEQEIEKQFENQWSDQLMDAITKELEEFFEG